MGLFGVDAPTRRFAPLPARYRVFSIALMSLLGCGRSGFYISVVNDRLTDSDSPTSSLPPWGEYVATLSLPPCPASPFPSLVVDTLTDELDGGEGLSEPSLAGPSLSFVEAIFIAANRVGVDVIEFTPDVFPVSTPGVIQVRTRSFPNGFAYEPSALCINARDRGVVIEWLEGLDSFCAEPAPGECVWHLQAGSVQVGLELRRLPMPIWVANGSKMAGCVLDAPYRQLEVQGTPQVEIGPGNVFAQSVWAVSVQTQSDVWIHDNFFSYDPRGFVYSPTSNTIALFAGALIEGNVFASEQAFQGRPPSGEIAVVRHNSFGVDTAGRQLAGSLSGIESLVSGKWIVGPGNVVRGTRCGVCSSSSAVTQVTRNSITGTEVGIVTAAPFAPPAITAVSATSVAGTCATPGMVEVFSDAGDQGETFLTDTVCGSSLTWAAATPVPVGRNVTATLTDDNGHTSAFSAPVALAN